jgi:hypothetical protein
MIESLDKWVTMQTVLDAPGHRKQPEIRFAVISPTPPSA